MVPSSSESSGVIAAMVESFFPWEVPSVVCAESEPDDWEGPTGSALAAGV